MTKNPNLAKFTETFSGYCCVGDTISTEFDGFDIVARIVHDTDYGIDDDDCYNVDQSVTGCDDEQFAWLLECRKRWQNDEWHYCGLVLSVSRNGVSLSDHAASLWGIKLNYPQRDGKIDNSYLNEVANELLDEAVKTAYAERLAILAKLKT